jgi:hypothetical protein
MDSAICLLNLLTILVFVFNTVIHVYDRASNYGIFLCWILPWRWPKKAEICRSFIICFCFNCCPSVHVDNHTIITPTKCTLLLLKASDITVCTLCHILPLHVSTRVGHLQGAQCQCLAKVIINYNLLKLC